MSGFRAGFKLAFHHKRARAGGASQDGVDSDIGSRPVGTARGVRGFYPDKRVDCQWLQGGGPEHIGGHTAQQGGGVGA